MSAWPIARRRWLAALVVVFAAGCDFVPGSAVSRARLFIEALVQDPPARESLAALAAPAATPELIEGMEARVAVNYLRARTRQGQTLDFVASAALKSAAGGRVVNVAVSDRGARAAGENRARFQVHLARDAERGWVVTRVQAD
jgi:hypothetical protein